MTRRRTVGLATVFVLAASGLGVSMYLTIRHWLLVGLVIPLPGNKAFVFGGVEGGGSGVCNVRPGLTCDVPLTSEYAEILGVPISLFGAGLYLVLLAAALSTALRRPERAAQVLFYSALVSLGAVGYSVYLASVSHLVLETWCPFCVSLYVVNVGLVAAGAAGCAQPMREGWAALREDVALLRARPKRLAVGLLVVLVALGGLVAWHRVQVQKAERELVRALELWKRSPALASLPLTGDEPARGPIDAPIQIVEYFDFQCGHCKRLHRIFDRLFAEYPGKLRIVAKHLPLAKECLPLLESDTHPQACLAAEAALCAGKQGRYWEMHDWLFLEQGHVTPDTLPRIARDAGVDAEPLAACLVSDEFMPRLKGEALEAIQALHVTATPAVWVNGKAVVEGVALIDLYRRIFAELGTTPNGSNAP